MKDTDAAPWLIHVKHITFFIKLGWAERKKKEIWARVSNDLIKQNIQISL